MKFFSRSRILCKILIVVDFIIGIIIAFQLPEIPDAIRLDYFQPLLIFSILCLIFIFILLMIIALKCIINDAQEDLNSVMRFSDFKKED